MRRGAVLCLALVVWAAPGARPASADALFGMHLPPSRGRPSARALDAMASLGVARVRAGVQSAQVEPRPGELHRDEVDALAAAMAARRLRLLLTVGAISPWGSTALPSNWGRPGYHAAYAPRDPARYAAFIEALVARYRGRGIAWQIGNEPNAPAFWKGTREEYLALLGMAYAAAHEADPGAVVLAAGLACGFSRLGTPAAKLQRIAEWFDAILASRAFDALDVHDYYPPEADNAWGVTFEQHLATIERGMASRGVAVPLWISEAGVSSAPVTIGGREVAFTPEAQARAPRPDGGR